MSQFNGRTICSGNQVALTTSLGGKKSPHLKIVMKLFFVKMLLCLYCILSKVNVYLKEHFKYKCLCCFCPTFRSFLLSKDGNPNKRNVHNETSLHFLCMGPLILTSEGALQPRISRPYEDEQRRAECLQIVLAWTGAKLDHGEYERADVNAADNKKNTCLHYAAASGMKTCVAVRFSFMCSNDKSHFC